jgi:hypothetical protein
MPQTGSRVCQTYAQKSNKLRAQESESSSFTCLSTCLSPKAPQSTAQQGTSLPTKPYVALVVKPPRSHAVHVNLQLPARHSRKAAAGTTVWTAGGHWTGCASHRAQNLAVLVYEPGDIAQGAGQGRRFATFATRHCASPGATGNAHRPADTARHEHGIKLVPTAACEFGDVQLTPIREWSSTAVFKKVAADAVQHTYTHGMSETVSTCLVGGLQSRHQSLWGKIELTALLHAASQSYMWSSFTHQLPSASATRFKPGSVRAYTPVPNAS